MVCTLDSWWLSSKAFQWKLFSIFLFYAWFPLKLQLKWKVKGRNFIGTSRIPVPGSSVQNWRCMTVVPLTCLVDSVSDNVIAHWVDDTGIVMKRTQIVHSCWSYCVNIFLLLWHTFSSKLGMNRSSCLFFFFKSLLVIDSSALISLVNNFLEEKIKLLISFGQTVHIIYFFFNFLYAFLVWGDTEISQKIIFLSEFEVFGIRHSLLQCCTHSQDFSSYWMCIQKFYNRVFIPS